MKRGMLFMLMIAAGCSSTPTEPVVADGGCSDLTGTYDVAYVGATCPSNGYPVTWQIEQSACSFHTHVLPDAPSVTGTVDGAAVTLEMRNGFIACTYKLDGSGQFDGRTLRATVSGDIGGPCCGSGKESMQIVAVRR